ncbi:hypothetical protein [Bacillus badius]|uniref:hypothetical protein n=1 Tax=Bacillus badius TaxID=1455 RepID=UPI0005970B71|nr:hypothetical protein [Bacillus badius]MED4715316.1 hypothetical protein [Bacillus badius]
MNRIGKVLLASTIILSGAGAMNALSLSSTVKAEIRENIGVTASYSSPAKDTLRSVLQVGGNSPSTLDFKTKHVPTFEIRNGSGTLTKRGSLNTWVQLNDPKLDVYEFQSVTNINFSALSPGNYRIYVSIPMDDGPINSSVNGSFTRGFTINPDRTITNIRP